MALYGGDAENRDRSLEGASMVEAIGNELVKSYGFGRNPDGSWDWSVDRIAKAFQDDPLWTTLDYLTLAVPVARWGTALRGVSKGVGAVGKAARAGEFAGRSATTATGRFVEAFVGGERAVAAEAYLAAPRRGLSVTVGGREFAPLGRFSNPVTQQLSDEYLAQVDRYGGEWWETRAIAKSVDRERVLAENLTKRNAEDAIRAWDRAGLSTDQLASGQRFLETGVDPDAPAVLAELGEAGARAYKNTWSYRNTIHEAAFDAKLISEETYKKHLKTYAPRLYTEWEKIRATTRALGDGLPAGAKSTGTARFQGRAEEALFEQILDPRASLQALAQAGQTIARQRYAQGLAQSVIAKTGDELRDLAVDIVGDASGKLAQLHGIDPKRVEKIRELMVSRRKVGAPMNAEGIGAELGWKRLDDLYEAGKVPGYVTRLPEELRGKWLDPAAAKDIEGTLRQLSDPEWYQKLYGAVLDTFRASKTAYNPATHVRNMVGSAIFHHFVTGGVPKAIPKLGWHAWRDETAEYAAALERGIVGSSFDSELKEGLRSAFRGANPDEKLLGKASALDWMGDGRIAKFLQKGASKAERFYRANDEIWKLDAFIEQTRKYRGKGLGLEDARNQAALDVNKFTPGMALHSEVADQLRKAVPFASFTTETLRVYKNLFAEKPHLAYFWNHAMESFSQVAGAMGGFDPQQIEEAKRALPEYAQGKKMVVVPFNIDGQPQFLDMSYMLPLGNMQATGTEGLFFGGLIDPTVNPILNAVTAGATGRDPFTGQEIQPRNTERQLGVAVTSQSGRRLVGLAEHMAAMMLPPLAPPGYAGINLIEAARGQINPASGEPLEKGVMTAIMRNIAGLRLETADVKSQVLNVRREQGRVREQISQAWQRYDFAKANGDQRTMQAEAERIIELRGQEGDDNPQAYFRDAEKKREPFSNLTSQQLEQIVDRARRLGTLSPESERARQLLEERLGKRKNR